MNSMNEQEIKTKFAELRAKRDTFAAKLTAALKTAGFTVTGKLPDTDNSDGALTVTAPNLHKNATLLAKFVMKGSSRLYRNWPSKVELHWGRDTGWHCKATRYSKFDDALVAKLVESAKAHIEGVLQYERNAASAQSDQERWEHHRAMELAGMTVPPGATVNVIMGTGSEAGKYKISFTGRGTGITGTALTREQMIKLMDVLNEIQGTAAHHVIVGTNKDGTQATWSGFGWWNNQEPSVFKTEAEALAALNGVIAQSPDHSVNIQVKPYTEVFTIKP
jgi:hypothetical protein